MFLPIVVVNDLSFLPLGRGRLKCCSLGRRPGPKFLKEMLCDVSARTLFDFL